MSNDPPNELPQRSGTFRAVVQAGSTITSYLRAGAGRPVVVLSCTAPDHAPVAMMLETLRGAFRVVIPDVPQVAPSSMEWFVAFLDGLGLSAVGIVVDHDLAPALLAFARGEEQRIARIVVLADADDRELPLGDITQPLLIVPDTADRVAAVAWFLAGAPERLGGTDG